MDEKWKLPRSCSQRNPSSTSKSPVLSKSFSQRSSASKSSFPSYSSNNASSSSHKHHNNSSNSNSSSQASSSKPALVRNVSRKCGTLAKEQKARFYIMRRCVAMLVCWHKHGDS